MKRKLRERTLHFQEMANLRPKTTGLPVNIWVDEAQKYKPHAKRIKFQLDYHTKLCDNLCSMLLDGSIPDSVKRSPKYPRREISDRDIQKVANFVKNNKYALEKLADQLLWFDDFREIMIVGGDIATSQQKKTLQRRTDELVELTQKENQTYPRL